MNLPIVSQPTGQQIAPYCENACGRQATVFRLALVSDKKVCQVVCAVCNVQMNVEAIK